MLLATVAIAFVVLILLSMPIVFALGVAGIAELGFGGYRWNHFSPALLSGWRGGVLLALPAFVFAASLLGPGAWSPALVALARGSCGSAPSDCRRPRRQGWQAAPSSATRT